MATISAVTLGAAGTYTLSAADFGARLVAKGQNIDIYNGLNYVNTSNVTAVQDAIGGAQIVMAGNRDQWTLEPRCHMLNKARLAATRGPLD